MLTPAQVADWLQMSRPALYRMNANGTGPKFLKAGSLTRYKREDVEAWLNGELA